MQKLGVGIIAAIMLGLAVFLLGKMNDMKRENAETEAICETGEDVSLNAAQEMQAEGLCIVIDAGHGGIDCGKVSESGILEKDINLQMAFLLRSALEEAGFTVVMTRESDAGLYDEDASNKKVQDLQRRVALIEESGAVMVISLHQNSYPDASVRGGQVFYFEESAEGECLASCIQNRIRQDVDPENHREIKGDGDYFLLQQTETVTVIVECGFLSNPQEAELLSREEYQMQMTEAIVAGIMDYLAEE